MEEKNTNLIIRPPVVVVLGHIDHGKTSLLDAIRKENVAEKESGGITQHIGAYVISHKDKKITFIDTPGHEAFSAMRRRGAHIADIAILVVDSVEGVKPQTKEAILEVKKAEIPMIVALTKKDKSGSNADKVRSQLVENEVTVESMGGKILSVAVSAKTKEGINELLELILLVAEMENLQADLSKKGQGIVIESFIESQKGKIASLLVLEGTLNVSDIIGTKSAFGKVKILEDFQGNTKDKILPGEVGVVSSTFDLIPRVGETFKVFENLEQAEKNVEKKEEKRARDIEVPEGKKSLHLVIKADVSGSLEAIEEVLKTIKEDKSVLHIILKDAGELNESDVKTAKANNACILAFRVKVSPLIERLTERENIKLVKSDIIYELVENVRKMMEGEEEEKKERIVAGKMRIIEIFFDEKKRQILGGRVEEGEIRRGSVEIMKGEEKKGEGRIVNVKKEKKDVAKCGVGEECGVLYEGNVKAEKGDNILLLED